MHAIDQIHEFWSSSMDNLEVFLNWFAFGWSVAAVLLFVVTWFYMPNTFADKAMEINMKWRKEKEEKKKTKAQKQLVQLRFQKQTTVDRAQNAKVRKRGHSSLFLSLSGFLFLFVLYIHLRKQRPQHHFLLIEPIYVLKLPEFCEEYYL